MTDIIKLKKWDYADAASVSVYANNRKIADNLRDGFPHPYSLKDANNFIRDALRNDRSVQLFAIDLNGEAIGSIGAVFKEDVYRKNVEIGYWLAEDHWGKGYTLKAISLIIKYIFDNFDIERVYAEPYADNKTSVRVLEKAGFSLEARFRRNVIKNNIIKDSYIYSILRSEYEQLK
ncbi:MAG TPA: GNAT family protein [Bacteroidales bacterium]|nr:GNAT family protein [Bacteroidales bacterium]